MPPPLPRQRPASRVPQPVADRGGGVDIGNEERLLEGRRPGDDVPVLVEHERVAVEDELVLTADRVHERDPAHVVTSPDGEHLLPLAALADVERRRGDVGDDVRPGEREIGRRRPRLPDVLADGGADQRLADLQQEKLPAGLEVAGLVEHAVVR